MEPFFIGQIHLFASNFAPRSWAFCDGQLLAINSNTALFSILGTTYGGDGRTTFALPDLRGRVGIGVGNGPGLLPKRLGQRGGVETVTLNYTQIPSHTHVLTSSFKIATNENAATTSEGSGNVLAAANSNIYAEVSGNPNEVLGGVSSSLSVVENTGGQQPHNNMQPYLCLNYIIALVGTYPSRS